MNDCDRSRRLVLRKLASLFVSGSDARLRIRPTTNISQFVDQFEGLSLVEDTPFSIEFWGELIEEEFGFKATPDEWASLWGAGFKKYREWDKQFGERLTFGDVVNFILPRVDSPEIPVEHWFGIACPRAGAFLFIQNRVRKIDPNAQEFGPSTHIETVLDRKAIERLWSELSWRTENYLPRLDEGRLRLSYLWTIDKFVIALVVMMTSNCLFWMNEERYLRFMIDSMVIGLGVIVAMALLLVLLKVLSKRRNPSRKILPEGIRTFRDLATIIARN